MIQLPCSPGELIDRLTILELKAERFTAPSSRARAEADRDHLRTIRTALVESAALVELERELAAINGRLWDVENALRQHEHDQDFGEDFVALARSVYRLNDERSRLKTRIDALLDSPVIETKEHPRYDP